MINKDKEVGGTHYADMIIEPTEIIRGLRLDFIQGNIVKYISRYKVKNGVEDLKKALHYCRIAGEDEDRTMNQLGYLRKLVIKMYCSLNNLDNLENVILEKVVSNDFVEAEKEINNLINR